MGEVTKVESSTLLQTALDAVCDGHPSVRDELVQDPCGHRRLQPVQSPLSGFSTEEIKKY